LSVNDHEKLEELYCNYKTVMLYTAYQVLKDQQLAEDAVQTAFLKVICNLDKITDTNCSRTRKYLVIIVRNVSINLYNQIKTQSETFLPQDFKNLAEKEPLLEDIVISEESLNQLLRNFASLDKKYADVLLLKYAYDYSESDIAELLDISYENVRVRLHRAKKKLWDELEGSAGYERA